MKNFLRAIPKLKLFLGMFFSLFMISFVFGYTNLSVGDVFIVMSNADSPDSFSFVSKKDISSGTVIYFTDNARSGDNTRRTGEGTLIFTGTQDISAATIISITGSSSATPSVIPSGIGNISKDGSFNLSTSNDNIIVYQGTTVGDSSPSFLYGIGFSDSSAWISSGEPTTNNSYVPSGLTLGNTAITLSYQNNQYLCSNLGMLTTSFVSDIANSSNWTGNNSNAYEINTCSFDAIAPSLSLINDVESGPVQSDTIAVNRDGATVKKRMYDADGSCSTSPLDYPNTYTTTLVENTEVNNGDYICFYGEDSVGNFTTLASSQDINIDSIKPTASVSYSPSVLTNTDVVATLTGESETITIDSVGGLTQTFTGNGTHLFEFHDVAGNTGESLATVTWIDKTSPTWTINNGTIAGPVQTDTINVTASDPNLDLLSLEYGFSTDSVCNASDIYTTSFTNSVDFNIVGDHTDYLCVRGSDSIGNISYQLVGQLNTDNTAPIISEFTAVTSPTNNDSPDYIFASNEAGSIVYGGDCSSTTSSAIAGNNTITFNSLSEGTHSNCTITVTDTAGNTSSTLNVSSFQIDQTAPTWSINDSTAAGPVQNDTINVTASDINLDGTSLIYGFSADNTCDATDTYSTLFTNSVDFNIGGNNTDYLCVRGSDTVGNISYQLVGQLNTDNTAPVIVFTDNVDVGPVQSDIISATRGDATVKKRDYDTDGICSVLSGDYANTYTVSLTENTETNNWDYICLYAEDSIGNRTTLVSSAVINIDITKPTATVSYSPPSLTNTDVLATLTGENESITIDSVGGDTHNFVLDGTHLFQFHDLAGNTGEALATVDWIDKVTPELTGTTTITSNNANGSFAKAGDTVMITFSVTEDLISNPVVNIVSGGSMSFMSKVGNTYVYSRNMTSG
ncbi:MAG TPA: hypothetical protein VJ892_04940, partial [Candidatus Absconditabacterales bacterium]|nr:hypothetical protein [Candidatus Absconditabacterales bacterium]